MKWNFFAHQKKKHNAQILGISNIENLVVARIFIT
jgi:hypothetical protein